MEVEVEVGVEVEVEVKVEVEVEAGVRYYRVSSSVDIGPARWAL